MGKKKVRGSIINGYIKYIRRTWGDRGVNDLEEKLNIDIEDINDREWYDVNIHSSVHEWIVENHGEDHLRRGGSFTVQNMGVLSYLIKFTSPKTMLKKAPKSYSDAFTYGDVKIDIEDEDDKAYIKFKDNVVDEYTCIGWLGVFEGILKATNTEGEVKVWDAKDKGEKDCYFIMRWK
ncbi:MAG: hypothetical protein R6W73_03460 [Candidatus Saliniplasma sp.]